MERRPKDVFFDALDQPADRQREWVMSVCGDDLPLRDKVLALLEAHYAASPLDRGAATIGSSWLAEPGRPPMHGGESIGDTIDRYELVMPLGEGGFGAVFLARQREPVVREVAVKILRSGLSSAQVVARFEAERQTLAIMDHPNIARVFDAGTTQKGSPYIVMEFVDGPPITVYCEQKKLPLEDRLRLVEQVCLAIQHAHQKGVIHRDIKPSNILIAQVDGLAVPKIIDFGIAKALDESASPALTQEMQIIGTPQYMSPEQATFGAKAIDTRSDIYSLGAVLYELVAGVPPFDPVELSKQALDGVLKVVRDETPLKPSTRVVHDRTLSVVISRTYGTEATRLRRQLAGDVDWIVMKALEKEPARRYQSVLELGEDIRRYLTHKPVLAGPPSRVYQLRKFVRRHRIEVSAAALVVLALVATVVVSLIMAKRAQVAERVARDEAGQKTEALELAKRESEKKSEALDRAETISFFMQDIFKGVDPAIARGRDVSVFREILDDAAKRAGTELKDKPYSEMIIRGSLAEAFQTIGETQAALEQAELAYTIGREKVGPDDPDVLITGTIYGYALGERSMFDKAQEVMEDTVRRMSALRHEDTPSLLSARTQLANIYSKRGQNQLAAEMYEKILQTHLRTIGPESERTLLVMNNLAGAYRRLEQLEKADELWRRALEAQKRTLGDDHPATLATLHNLAVLAEDRNELEAAEAYYRESIAGKRRILPPGHQSLITGLSNLGGLLQRRGKLSEADLMLSEALKLCLETLGESDARTFHIYFRLIPLRRQQQRYAEALDYATKVHAGMIQLYGETDERAQRALSLRIACLTDLGEYAQAVELLKFERRIENRVHQDANASLDMSVAKPLALLGRTAEAKARLERAIATMSDSPILISRLSERVRELQEILASPTTLPTTLPTTQP